MGLLSTCPGQLYDPDHNRSKPVRACQRQPCAPACTLSLRSPRVSQSMGNSERLLTSPVRHTRLHRPVLLFQPVIQPTTMVSMIYRDPSQDRLLYHKRQHQTTPLLISLSSGIHCLQTADRLRTLCSTIKILRDTRLRRSLT